VEVQALGVQSLPPVTGANLLFLLDLGFLTMKLSRVSRRWLRGARCASVRSSRSIFSLKLA
jgi:hypothetical protein